MSAEHLSSSLVLTFDITGEPAFRPRYMQVDMIPVRAEVTLAGERGEALVAKRIDVSGWVTKSDGTASRRPVATWYYVDWLAKDDDTPAWMLALCAEATEIAKVMEL